MDSWRVLVLVFLFFFLILCALQHFQNYGSTSDQMLSLCCVDKVMYELHIALCFNFFSIVRDFNFRVIIWLVLDRAVSSEKESLSWPLCLGLAHLHQHTYNDKIAPPPSIIYTTTFVKKIDDIYRSNVQHMLEYNWSSQTWGTNLRKDDIYNWNL